MFISFYDQSKTINRHFKTPNSHEGHTKNEMLAVMEKISYKLNSEARFFT